MASRQYSEYRTLVDQMRGLLDRAQAENRELTGEEASKFDRMNDTVTRLSRVLQGESDLREFGDPNGETEQQFRKLISGEVRSIEVVDSRERRDLTKLTAGAGGNTVQTGFFDRLVEHMIENSGILTAGPTDIPTDSGEKIQVPTTTAHGTAVLVAEGGTFTESDSTFGQVEMGAFKYARMLQMSSELVEDEGVNLLDYIARDCGRSVGNMFGTHAVTGTGTGQPQGVATAAGAGVTGGAGVAGAFTADNLIDLHYSVTAPYRASKSCVWLVKDSTLAAIRKLKDTTNQYLWQPSLIQGQPETLLGKPIITDPNVAAVALSAKSVLFGAFDAYGVRRVKSMRFERSDGFAFNQDLITFRAVARMDGRMLDSSGALKSFVGNAA